MQDGTFATPNNYRSENMDEKDKRIDGSTIASFLKEGEVKVVWREEDKTKVGRGMIINDDENFVYLSGEKGKVAVNKKDVIAIKQ
mgnify:FL=1|tara:strand:+ start:36 stop:290 length:255 start_codon:yes stop_codon:yes gene_type:complete